MVATLPACASFGDITGPKAIPNSVASVEVPLSQPMLGVGSTLALQVMVRDAGGHVVADRPVLWSSSDTTVARVTTAGVVTALRAGTVHIAASVDGRSAVAALTITARAVASVVVQPSNPRLLVGGQLQLFSTIFGDDGDTLSGRNVLWTSSDPRIATVDNVGLLTGLAVGATSVTATSENRTATVGVTVTAVPVSAVQVTPAVDSVVVGQTTQLSGSARDSIGGALSDRPIIWLSSDPAIATVSSSGTVLGASAGSVTISASAEGKVGTARIVVKARPVSAIIVSPTASTLSVGQTVKLSVLITDVDGTLLTGRPLQFVSSNTSVAQVAADGTVTARTIGMATITVTSEGRIGTATVTVTASPVATVRVDPATNALVVGGTVKLSAVASDGAGNTLSQRPVTWTSGAPTVATVASDGTVTGVTSGTALIFATVEGKIASASVTVRDIAVSAVVVTPASSSLSVGDVVDLTVVVREAGGSVLTGRTVLWSSSDERIAAVTSTGRVHAIAVGQALITASVDGVTGSAAITSSAESVLTITVEPSSLGLFPGATATLTATARGRNGVALPGRGFAYVSSDLTVATVSIVGVVTAVKAGSATITITSEGKSTTVPVTVSPAPVATVAVALADPSRFVGQTTQATSTAKDAGGNVLAGRTVAWTSSNTSVATVTASGVVTAVAPGTASIIATVEGKSASATLTVSLVPVATVSVVLAQSARFVGQSTQATATTRDAQNNVLNGRAVSFSTSNSAVATVNAVGTVTAVGVGTANIIASSEGQSGSAVLTVTVPPVVSVAVTATSTTRYASQSSQATAVLRDAQGNVLSGRAISWTSSNPAVASVTVTGLITALSVGNADITATSEGVSGSVTVTVTPVPVETVDVTLAQNRIATGKSTQASAVTRDPNGTVLNGRVVSWTSSNPNVASVSSAGVVTGVQPGTTNITATSEGKSGFAVATIVILPVGTVNVTLGLSSMSIGQSAQASVTTIDTSGTVVFGRAITWSSSAPSVATVSSTGVVTAVNAGNAIITATSEGVQGSAPVAVSFVPVATVSVTFTASTIVANATTNTSVVLRDANNNVLSGRAIQFASSNTSVATVSATGVVTALQSGTTTISATSEGKTGSAVLTVTAAPVATVIVSVPTTTTFKDRNIGATAMLYDSFNNALSGRAVSWSSSNNSIATVNSSGVISTVGVGSVTITATSEGKTGSVTLSVSLAPIATVTVTLASSSIATFQSTQATAVLKDIDGNVLTGRTVAWSTSNSAIATVTQSGAVTGSQAGLTDVIASSEGVNGSTAITVSNSPVATVAVSLASSSVTQGQTTQATATLRDASDNVLSGRAISWFSGNSAVATVNASGVVTAVGAGTANIIATSEGKSGSTVVTVTAVPVATVTVSLASNTLAVGSTTQATAVTRDGSNNVLTGRVIVWSSSNTSVATVNASGVVTAAGAGTANIVATSETKTGSATLTVNAVVVPVASVSVALSPASVTVGGSSQATATTRDASNNVLNGRSIAWSSSNTSVATVNASGMITTVAVGSANIIATSEGQTGSAALTVTAVPVASVDVSLAASAIVVGATTQATATPRDASNNALTGRTVTWASSNTSVATVNVTSGLVTAIGTGGATITATSETKTGSAVITVSAVPVATVTVALSPASVAAGSTSQATATTRDASNNVLTGRTVTWSSSNTAVATVNAASGAVSSVAAGTANIIATSETKTGSAILTVTAVPVATVTVVLSPTSVTVGGQSQATATTRDASNNVLTGRQVTWSSSNTSIATVNMISGVVSTVAVGTVTITGTSETQSGSATLTVTAAAVATVTVALSPNSINTTQVAQATASTFDSNNAPLTGRAISWSSSNTSVATVNVTGRVTAVGAGTADIIATSEGKTGFATITVTLVPVDSVLVTMADSSIFTGETVQATATLRDANHNLVTGRAVTWSTSNSSIATITQLGVVSAVNEGTVDIIATSEGKSDFATLTITLAPVASVTVTLAQPTLAVGGTTQATAVLRDANNNVLTGRTVTWSSSDTTVAAVNARSGVVKANETGSAFIMALSEGKTGSAKVTVP